MRSHVSHHPLEPKALSVLNNLAASVGLGATEVVAASALSGLDLPLRDASSHAFLGGCLTQPDEGRFILGLEYRNKTGSYKEDLAIIDQVKAMLSVYHKGAYPRLDSRFAHTHHADRSSFPFVTDL
jgi:hypothetical protein